MACVARANRKPACRKTMRRRAQKRIRKRRVLPVLLSDRDGVSGALRVPSSPRAREEKKRPPPPAEFAAHVSTTTG
ncbi:hypothetical protein MRX96_003975 [Rhipicephalus microplus]